MSALIDTCTVSGCYLSSCVDIGAIFQPQITSSSLNIVIIIIIIIFSTIVFRIMRTFYTFIMFMFRFCLTFIFSKQFNLTLVCMTRKLDPNGGGEEDRACSQRQNMKLYYMSIIRYYGMSCLLWAVMWECG